MKKTANPAPHPESAKRPAAPRAGASISKTSAATSRQTAKAGPRPSKPAEDGATADTAKRSSGAVPAVSAHPASAQSKAPVTTKKSESKAPAKPVTKLAAKVENKPGVNVMITATVSQTTDAATLAAIDTSGYVLPSVKVPG
ncbi:MAG: RNA polymerase sigma factor RpoD, partial [Pseudomonadota bacterium]|nr:RNA polymerase sigma factor RpoD [Pseudomonadota bacterium]